MKIFTKSRMLGARVAVPKERRYLADLPFDPKATRRVAKAVGIDCTRTAPKGMTCADYAATAAQELLADLQIQPAEIDALIFATAYHDLKMPGTTSLIQERLGLRQDILAFDFVIACTGFVQASLEAAMLIETGLAEKVLVMVGELPTPAINPRDRALLSVCSDNGAAAIYGRSDCRTSFSFELHGSKWRALTIEAGGSLMPIEPGKTDRETVDGNGNYHSPENLVMAGQNLMSFVLEYAPKNLRAAAEGFGCAVGDFDIYAFHQANALIVTQLAKFMELDLAKVPLALKTMGNIGPSSTLAALSTRRTESHLWHKAAFCTFGAGLAAASMCTDLSETKFYELMEI